MKLIAIVIAFAAALASAAPSANSPAEIEAFNVALDKFVVRDSVSGCPECTDHYDMCMTVSILFIVAGGASELTVVDGTQDRSGYYPLR